MSVPIFAYAHSVFAMSCDWNSLATTCAHPSNSPITRSPGFVRVFAYAHTIRVKRKIEKVAS
jgi:hypothetical protein